MPLRWGLAFAFAPGLATVLLASATAAADDPTKEECVAANESAQDLQAAGKLVSARAQLLTCAAKACPRVVRQDCSDRLRSVEKVLPTIVLTPRDARGVRVNDATLAVDGAPRVEALDGAPIFVDPGQHTFTVTAPGRPMASVHLSLNEGDRARADAIFKASPASTAARPSTDEGAAGGSAPAIARETSSIATTSGGHSRLRWIAWSAVGAGAASLVFGSVIGIVALGDHSKLARACPDWHVLCPADSAADIDLMRDHAWASTIGFVVAALGIGTGGALLLLSPEGSERPPADHGAAALQVHPWIGL
ncbi:MAG TPA: hypothetical protein VH044_03170, partial [Polyangiaceae bacterium]|nr:hypothetical protein [Polyangiaceae bacterium]